MEETPRRAGKKRAAGVSRHRLTLNVTAFDTLMAHKRITNTTAEAAYLDVGIGTIYRARAGDPVSAEFVAAVAKKVPRGTRWEDLFIPGDRAPIAA